MNNKVAYMQPYWSQVVKKKKIVVMCKEKKRMEGQYFYYFIRQFILFYCMTCKNKNWDVK